MFRVVQTWTDVEGTSAANSVSRGEHVGCPQKDVRDAKMCTAKWAKRTSEGMCTASILQLRLVRWQDRKRSSGVALLPRFVGLLVASEPELELEPERRGGRGSEGTQERVHVDTDARGMDRIDRGSSFGLQTQA